MPRPIHTTNDLLPYRVKYCEAQCHSKAQFGTRKGDLKIIPVHRGDRKSFHRVIARGLAYWAGVGAKAGQEEFCR